MSKFRPVSTSFWNDRYIKERGGIHPDFRLLFLWAITNPASEQCGVFEVAIDDIMTETGLSESRIIEGFQKFERDGKLMYRDGWVVVKNQIKYQQNKSPNIQAGIARGFERAPDWTVNAIREGFGDIQIQPQQPHLIEPPSARPTPSPAPKATAPQQTKAPADSSPPQADDDDDKEDDSPLPHIAVTKVAFEIKKRMSIPTKGKLPNERHWENITRQAIGNGLSADDVIEAFDLLHLQGWRKSAVTPKQVDEYLTPLNLNRLRDEISAQGKNKENGNGRTKQNNGTGGRESSKDRIIRTGEYIRNKYPTEAELAAAKGSDPT